MCATKKIVGERWIIATDDANECYRILTARNVQEHDGIPEQVWIANVFELEDAVNIVKAHNATLKDEDLNDSKEETCKSRELNQIV